MESTQKDVGAGNTWLARCFPHVDIGARPVLALQVHIFISFFRGFVPDASMDKLELASILVGDHLGQVKKVFIPSGEVIILPNCAEPDKSNPVVSIEPIHQQCKNLIATKNGNLYVYDSVQDSIEQCQTANDSLIKALPFAEEEVILVYDRQICFESSGDILKQKKGRIKNAKVHEDKLGVVGEDIPLRLYDLNKKSKPIFEAGQPEKNWLGIQPETYVANLEFIGSEGKHIATCSKSDSVIRLYDIRQAAKSSKPVVSINLNHEAFNEHADAGKFVAIHSTVDNNCIVVGSNVGQLIAIDLRLSAIKPGKSSKETGKKFKPRGYKVVGGFKGARGATIKDVKIVPAQPSGHKLISCCLDRYLRLHNFSKTNRSLDQHVYMKTKPLVCSPIFYQNSNRQPVADEKSEQDEEESSD